MIHFGEDPFGTPVELREPARRFRGRLVAPVTGWISIAEDGTPAAITVSSIMVAEGTPAAIVGLLDPLSEFWSALEHTERFVVHVFDRSHRRVADQFAGRYPGPDARFENVELSTSSWGPVVEHVKDRAYCTLASFTEIGDLLLVRGDIDKLELADADLDPLAYFRGHYQDVKPRHT